MRFLKQDITDDSKFVEWLDAIIAGVFYQLRPRQLYVVKVDNWFGKRWLRFSGKSLGAIGVSKRDLTMLNSMIRPLATVASRGDCIVLELRPACVHKADGRPGTVDGNQS